MNKFQAIALVIAIVNLLLVFLFPPFDYIALARSNVPTFEGFAFAFGEHPGHVVNANFLQIEAFVILVNAAIAWLLLGLIETFTGIKVTEFNIKMRMRFKHTIFCHLFKTSGFLITFFFF